MKRQIKAILYDLDGTILDTNELIIVSFLHALAGEVSPEFGREHIIPSMGLPLRHQFQQFVGRDHVDELVAKYRAFNNEAHDKYVRAFPHVQSVLQHVHERGIKQGVVTSKIRMTSLRGLEYIAVAPYIVSEAIVTIDEVTKPKPHPEGIIRALQALNVEPHEAIMLGDSAVDMQAATAAGVLPVGVSWSLKPISQLRDSGAAAIINDMRQLLELIDKGAT